MHFVTSRNVNELPLAWGALLTSRESKCPLASSGTILSGNLDLYLSHVFLLLTLLLLLILLLLLPLLTLPLVLLVLLLPLPITIIIWPAPLLVSRGLPSTSVLLVLLLLLLLFTLRHLVEHGPVLLGQGPGVEAEARQLQLVEGEQLLAAHRGLLHQAPQGGVILAAGRVYDPWEARQETREAVLHLLGGQFGVAVLEVLAVHEVGGSRHLTHHYRVWLGQVEGPLLDDGRL